MLQGKQDMVETAERRRHTRSKAKEGAIVVIPTNSEKLYGFLIDISKGGISFDYVPVDEELIETDTLNIVLDDIGLRFDGLPFKSISDFEIIDEYYSPIRMRRKSGQFIGLTAKQLSSLEYFIQNSAQELPQTVQ
jgi:hypothetical protein